MAKDRQNIVVEGRAANERITAAIPVFENRFGMPKDQATAVAIRLESVGRLHGVGLISVSEKPKGTARLATLALGVSLVPKRTIQREGNISATSVEELREAMETKPSKAAQRRLKKTRKRKK